MLKGLEALKLLDKNLHMDYNTMKELDKAEEIIEKELKAFAIINKYFYSEHIIHDLYCLGATDEEIALVKEILNEH